MVEVAAEAEDTPVQFNSVTTTINRVPAGSGFPCRFKETSIQCRKGGWEIATDRFQNNCPLNNYIRTVDITNARKPLNPTFSRITQTSNAIWGQLVDPTETV